MQFNIKNVVVTSIEIQCLNGALNPWHNALELLANTRDPQLCAHCHSTLIAREFSTFLCRSSMAWKLKTELRLSQSNIQIQIKLNRSEKIRTVNIMRPPLVRPRAGRAAMTYPVRYVLMCTVIFSSDKKKTKTKTVLVNSKNNPSSKPPIMSSKSCDS